MKVAPIIAALRERTLTTRLVHTEQHYDDGLSKIFFDELDMPVPDVMLGIGSGTHGEQTGRVLMAFEKVLLERPPHIVVVGGDVNSTLACALAAAKLGIRVAHVEAGLRSRDRSMPEELNRILTDQLADVCFTPSPDADENLRAEGILGDRICRVGNIMIDTLLAALPRAKQRRVLADLKLRPGEYAFTTFHRPSNVDKPEALTKIARVLSELSAELPVVLPLHPRTRARLTEFGIALKGVTTLPPIGYLDCVALESAARLVLTDSGGIQEETTALGVPCLTLRENTERPITVEQGTNHVVGTDPNCVLAAAREVMRSKRIEGRVPELWDGNAARRIVNRLVSA